MDVITSEQDRRIATARRRPPAGTKTTLVEATSDGDITNELGMFPTDIRLETTFDNGQISPWFVDDWWIAMLRRFKDHSLSLHVLPTTDALLHPIVMHELEMVRRLQTPWRLIGHCYLDDVGHSMLVHKISLAPYDEIRVITADRPQDDRSVKRVAQLSFEELAKRVRTQQIAEKMVYPLLTRAPLPPQS